MTNASRSQYTLRFGNIVPWSLGEIGDRRAVAPLMEQLKSEDRSLRVLAMQALEKLGAR